MTSRIQKEKSIVLLSGGLDSTVNFLAARLETEIEMALTFDYGQRAKNKEIERSAALCTTFSVRHKILDLRWISQFGQSALIDMSKCVPTADQVEIQNFERSKATAKSVWVPNRNGIFLNIAAGFAESLGAKIVIPGFNREEASTFPDNSLDFMGALDRAFEYSTQNKVKVKCFTVDHDKTEIVKYGKSLGLKRDMFWPCYFDGSANNGQWCEKCESCLRSLRAMDSESLD